MKRYKCISLIIIISFFVWNPDVFFLLYLWIGAVDPSIVLDQIESEICNAKDEVFSRKEILEKVEKWIAACEEESWLEEYNRVRYHIIFINLEFSFHHLKITHADKIDFSFFYFFAGWESIQCWKRRSPCSTTSRKSKSNSKQNSRFNHTLYKHIQLSKFISIEYLKHWWFKTSLNFFFFTALLHIWKQVWLRH